jgi:Fe-S cluster biosynthesis and repair protein YggX
VENFLLHNLLKTELAMKRVRIAWRQWSTKDTVEIFMSKLSGRSPRDKNKYNQCYHCRGISEIKLKRTDTTLDLSQ